MPPFWSKFCPNTSIFAPSAQTTPGPQANPPSRSQNPRNPFSPTTASPKTLSVPASPVSSVLSPLLAPFSSFEDTFAPPENRSVSTCVPVCIQVSLCVRVSDKNTNPCDSPPLSVSSVCRSPNTRTCSDDGAHNNRGGIWGTAGRIWGVSKRDNNWHAVHSGERGDLPATTCLPVGVLVGV